MYIDMRIGDYSLADMTRKGMEGNESVMLDFANGNGDEITICLSAAVFDEITKGL